MEEKFQRDEERRRREKEQKAATNSTERGAFVMTSKVMEEHKKATEDFFEHNMNSVNLLNTTLQNSEKGREVLLTLKLYCNALFSFVETNERAERSALSLRKEFAVQRKKMAETQDDRGAKVAEVQLLILCTCLKI